MAVIVKIIAGMYQNRFSQREKNAMEIFFYTHGCSNCLLLSFNSDFIFSLEICTKSTKFRTIPSHQPHKIQHLNKTALKMRNFLKRLLSCFEYSKISMPLTMYKCKILIYLNQIHLTNLIFNIQATSNFKIKITLRANKANENLQGIVQ